jgi:perosamine synthetase
MIPRLRPALGAAELRALLRPPPDAVAAFEVAFALRFEANAAIAFPYGRSALHALFRGLGVKGAEVIVPAYTCSVVAHAVILSGNVPRFVDIDPGNFNMRLDEVEAALNERTGAVVATHLFGYPLDVNRLERIVRTAEARYGRRILVVQDCAHSFGARWEGQLVCNAGDAAIFGLNVSKLITSIFGGMLTTRDPELAGRVRVWRDAHHRPAGTAKALLRRAYLLAAAAAFTGPLYSLVYLLQESTPFLNRLTRAYHLDEKIHFPPDADERMLDVEAAVGLAQLARYDEIVERRTENARFYAARLAGVPGLELPPLVEGATYSHFVVRVPDRGALLREVAKAGVQLGELIEYSLPHLEPYRDHAGGGEFPVSLACSRSTVNLPLHAGVGRAERERVVLAVARAAEGLWGDGLPKGAVREGAVS